jgi:aspartyl protease family protein
METRSVLSLLIIGVTQSLTSPALALAGAIDRQAQPAPVAVPAVPPQRRGGFVVIGSPAVEIGRGNEVRRARDGLFYVTALVNGTAVRFVVDTGATVVVLSAADARRAGIALDRADFNAHAETANGRTAMARVKLDQVTVGNTRAEAIEAAVVNREMPASLLGQSWLSRLVSFTITGDKLVFN